MKKLLKKEFVLALHPTSIIFLLFSLLVFVPNYLYEVVFFFSCLSVFFICLNGRENKDLNYTVSLPVEKKKVALARILLCIILQLVLVFLVTIFTIIKTFTINMDNVAGMEANMALIGFGLIILSVFNIIFFPIYFKNPNKVGVPFIIGAIVDFVIIFIVTTLVHAVPVIASAIDTPDTQFSVSKLIILFVGVVTYIVLNVITCMVSMRRFDKTDL